MATTGFAETGNYSLERAPEQGQPTTHTDAFSAYRMPTSAEATAPKPNVVEDGNLFFPPLFNTSSTDAVTPKTSTAPGTTPDATIARSEATIAQPQATIAQAQAAPDAASAAQTPVVDTRSPAMSAAVTDQGELPDPGLAVPMSMRFAPDAMQTLYQQEYGVSALDGFTPGAPQVDIAAVGFDGTTSAQDTSGQDASLPIW